MPAKPPPLPEAVYHRVMSVAKAEGYSILIVAGLSAFLAAAAGGAFTAVLACLAAGTGAMEIHGAQQLARGDERAINWLVRAQLSLLLIILVYVFWRITHFDAALVREQIPEFRRQMAELSQKWNSENPYDQLTDSQLVLVARAVFTVIYCVVGVVTCVYQPLMARYYHKRRAAIAQALAAGA